MRTINEEVKIKMFEKMLELEHLANEKTYSGRDYFEQSEGAFSMLMILGLSSEYINWSYGK